MSFAVSFTKFLNCSFLIYNTARAATIAAIANTTGLAATILNSLPTTDIMPPTLLVIFPSSISNGPIAATMPVIFSIVVFSESERLLNFFVSSLILSVTFFSAGASFSIARAARSAASTLT